MATSTYTTRQVANWPFGVMRVIDVLVAGNTATEVTHAGPAKAPDLWWVVNTTTNPTASEMSAYSPTSTTITIDCEATSGTYQVILIWFGDKYGGITPS